MSFPFYQVDAFTTEAFRGNPAAVVILPEWLEDERLAAVAREMNLSETAYLVRREAGSWSLRWFTPAVEVDLCGHATLASAHVLWERREETGEISFSTRSGDLGARRENGWILLDFPATPAEETTPDPRLLEALGLEPTAIDFVGRNREDVLVVVDREETVRDLAPDLAALRGASTRGVIVSAPSAGEADFVSRYFAPAAGVDEDPVTGSTHCTLGPYWAERLGRPRLVGFQCSRRGGRIRVTVRENPRVELGGRAVTVIVGDLRHAGGAMS